MVLILLKKLHEKIDEKTRASEQQFVPYGILGFLGFCGFYFFNTHYIGENAYENITIRAIAGSLSLFLIFRKYWPEKLKKLMPLYWNFTLCFNTPFFFTFMFLKNSGEVMWLTHSLSALIIFLLLTDWISCLTLLCLGIATGSLAYVLTTPYPHLPDNISTFLIIYVAMVGHALFASHRNSVAQKERINTMRTLAGAMAHELRTPLGGISLIAQVLKMHIPALVTGYKQAKEVNPDLEDADTEYVQHAPDEITLTTRNAFNVIDILLMNVKGASNEAPKETCHIKACIQNALNAYPLTIDEKELITCNLEDDFTFQGNELFMRHVIFNLLKNALYYVKAANKGGIFITAQQTHKENIVIFKDTGKGMPSSMVPHVFDRFYSKTQHGTGIGLAFCKSVMESLGGKISCKAEEGQHTTFILSFPKA